MTRRAPGVLVALALLAAACGSDEPPAASTAADDGPRTEAVRFAECMRDEGVAGFPDPDASGELTIDGVLNGSSIDAESPAWRTAIAACEDLQPPGFTGPGRRSSEEQGAALRFAQCIRDNGVGDFPDPVNGEPLVNTNLIPSTERPGGMDVLDAAMRACEEAGREAREER